MEQVVFSPDGRAVASTGDDARVIVWNPATGQPIETLAGHGGPVTGAAFWRDGRTLFTASPDGAIFEWDLGLDRRFGQPLTTMATPPRLGFARRAGAAAARDLAGRIRVRCQGGRVDGGDSTRPSTLERLRMFPVEAGGDVIGLAWSSGGELAVTGDSGHVQLWDVQGRPTASFALCGVYARSTGYPEAVTTIAFSPDGRLVAAGDINHSPGASLPIASAASLSGTPPGGVSGR